MMGRKYREQANFFYEFRLDDMIPKRHLLRRINVFVTSTRSGSTKSSTPGRWSGTGRRKLKSAEV